MAYPLKAPSASDNSAYIEATQVVAVGASSAASAVVNSKTVFVILNSTVACWVSVGSNPTAVAAGANSFYLTGNFQYYPIAVEPGVTKIAVIQASSGGSLSIAEFGYQP
mgnify:CR=1 FL=1